MLALLRSQAGIRKQRIRLRPYVTFEWLLTEGQMNPACNSEICVRLRC